MNKTKWWNLLGLVAAAAILMAAVPAQAQTAEDTYLRTMKAAFSSAGQTTNYAGQKQALDSAGTASANCQSYGTAMQSAAGDYAKSGLPPDPSQVMKSSTCLTSILNVKIPTTGFGAVDMVIGMVMSQVLNCNATSGSWLGIMGQMVGGNLSNVAGTVLNNVGGSLSLGSVGSALGSVTGSIPSVSGISSAVSGAITSNVGGAVSNAIGGGSVGNVVNGAVNNAVSGTISSAGQAVGAPQQVTQAAQQAATNQSTGFVSSIKNWLSN